MNSSGLVLRLGKTEAIGSSAMGFSKVSTLAMDWRHQKGGGTDLGVTNPKVAVASLGAHRWRRKATTNVTTTCNLKLQNWRLRGSFRGSMLRDTEAEGRAGILKPAEAESVAETASGVVREADSFGKKHNGRDVW